jgi:ferric-dicitrate binding protein FerR (iron transport regulator)
MPDTRGISAARACRLSPAPLLPLNFACAMPITSAVDGTPEPRDDASRETPSHAASRPEGRRVANAMLLTLVVAVEAAWLAALVGALVWLIAR